MHPVVLTLIGIGVAVVLFLLRPRSVFVVELRDGKARVRRGKVPRGFVSECETIASAQSLPAATITGVRSDGRIVLRFSSALPEHVHQTFRNVWALHAPLPSGPGGDPPRSAAGG